MCVAALAGLFVLTNTFPAAAEGNQDSKTVNSAERYPGTGSVCTVCFHDLANVHKYLLVSEC